jgi:adenosylcobinamide-GDP ribazoletransferase
VAQTDSDDATQATPPTWPGWLIATATCIRFYSRLPVPALPGESPHALPDFRLVPRALPFAALVIALPAALIALLAGLAGVNALLTAALAVTGLVVATGAFHEDGLADSADGLFGGHTPERRLEIMKDSRVGTFGALALGLSLLLRVTALAAILQGAGAWAVAAAVLAAAPWSRVEGIRILATVEPTRRDGASAAVGQPTRSVLPIAYGLSGALALLLAATGRPPPRRHRARPRPVGSGDLLVVAHRDPPDRRADRRHPRRGAAARRDRDLSRPRHRHRLGRTMSAISSPCIKICVIDPGSRLCQGCGRTLQEITQWSRLSEEERLAIMATLDERLRPLRDGQAPRRSA